MEATCRLAVDLGTSHTVAVVRRGAEAPRALIFDSSPLLPSGVYAEPGGGLHVGADAERLSVLDPSRFEPYPKRRIDEGSVLLGDTEVAVVELLAAVLRRVVVEARTAGASDPGQAGATVLTCPADWGRQRRAVLLAAAHAAGLGQVRLVEEPIAAATYCEQVLRQQVPPGQCLTIFDFGGGTLDVSVVRRDPDGLRVLSIGGLDDLGGVDVDAALVGHLGQLIAIREPQLWQRLANPDGIVELRDRRTFWSEVRSAKEMLSRTAAAPIQVPGGGALHLTREEMDRVAGPLVDRAVDETRRVLQRAGIGPEQLAGIFLVGGSSRIPLVASRLHARFGMGASVPEQPELPVAYGALLAAAPDPATGGAHPATGGANPATGGADPVSGADLFAGGPTSGVPISPAAGGYPAAPISASPTFSATPYTPPGGYPAARPEPEAGSNWPRPPGGPFVAPDAGPVPAQPAPRGARSAIGIAAVVTVILLALTGGWYTFGRTLFNKATAAVSAGSGTGDGSGGNSSGGDGAGPALAETRPAITLSAVGATWAISDGQYVYYAEVGTGQTKVTAAPVGGGANRWSVAVPIEPEEVHLSVQSGLLIVDGRNSATDGGKNARAVLDLATGTQRWKGPWVDMLDVAYPGTDVIVEVRGSKPATERVDLLTGKVTWSHPGPQGSVVIDDRRVGAVLSWPTDPVTHAAPAPLDDTNFAGPDRAAFRRSLAADPTIVVELDEGAGKASVVETGTGRASRSGNVALDMSKWTVFDSLIIGRASDAASPSKDVLYAYDLTSLARKWELPAAVGDKIKAVRPCGQHLVCVVTDLNVGDLAFSAVDTRTGKESWRNPMDFAVDAGWYPLGGQLLFGDSAFAPVYDPVVLDPVTGKSSHAFGTNRQFHALAGDGPRAALEYFAANSHDYVGVGDLRSGRRSGGVDLGEKQAKQVSLVGDILTVITEGHQLRIARVPALN